jgi:agmatine deiminase
LNVVQDVGVVSRVGRSGWEKLMIADHETNVVYVADTLERRFPSVYGGLRTILERHSIPLRTIPGTRDIWCRDYMPIQVAEDRFVQFRYAPDYLTGKHRHLRADGQIGPSLPFTRNCVRSEIVLDGGNVVKWSDRVILTDKVLSENTEWDRKSLFAELKRLLEVERVILIPPEPGDVVGHADGVVRFIAEHTLLVNDYRDVEPEYGRGLRRLLSKEGMTIVEAPYEPKSGRSGSIPSAVGNYLNYLQTGSVIIWPSYSSSGDERAREVLGGTFPGSTLISLNCTDLASDGGVLNCVSWGILGHPPSEAT